MIAGLKLAGVVGAASAIAIGALWWQLGNAQDEADQQRERAGALRAQIDQAAQAANRNAERAEELAAELERKDQLVADYAQTREARTDETIALLRDEEVISREAPIEYRDCLAVPAPDGIARLLHDDTGA